MSLFEVEASAGGWGGLMYRRNACRPASVSSLKPPVSVLHHSPRRSAHIKSCDHLSRFSMALVTTAYFACTSPLNVKNLQRRNEAASGSCRICTVDAIALLHHIFAQIAFSHERCAFGRPQSLKKQKNKQLSNSR